MVDENGKITIPGFYDDVMEVSAEERELLGKAPFSEEEYKKAIDVEEVGRGKRFYSNGTTPESGQLLMFVEFGVDIPAKVQKQFFLQKHLQKYHVDWYPTRITIKLLICLKIILKVLLQNQ